jgi:hypothetical protein
MLEASGVPTAAGFKGAAEAAETKTAVAPIIERIVFMPNSLGVASKRRSHFTESDFLLACRFGQFGHGRYQSAVCSCGQ